MRWILAIICRMRGHRLICRWDKLGRCYLKCVRCGRRWRKKED
jgi:hypothetical protein